MQQWRARLTYAAMSAFVAWHTIAMLIAPAPDVSAFVQALRVPFHPYLVFFRLDNMWDFFAPNVGRTPEFRYIIEDTRGNHHPFAPTENLSWFHPTFFWFRSWFDAIMANPDAYADSAAAFIIALPPEACTLTIHAPVATADCTAPATVFGMS